MESKIPQIEKCPPKVHQSIKMIFKFFFLLKVRFLNNSCWLLFWKFVQVQVVWLRSRTMLILDIVTIITQMSIIPMSNWWTGIQSLHHNNSIDAGLVKAFQYFHSTLFYSFKGLWDASSVILTHIRTTTFMKQGLLRFQFCFTLFN